ncbi:MAG TPA: hypothetical protein PK875_12455 [Spirochaetota bacterium]|jgi:hypothetical protein|nr:MAG: hypothetical protein BWY96_00993 [Spirochaetes bacterium ADurb.BinA120]HPI15554.1 hypothetical protein [Spirochaetota bacterium]HPO46596.1 hypothetical protein [Spirochaetota bacterium]
MAKPTRNAALICGILTVIAALGAAASIYWTQPLAVIIAALPAAAYELYRTEGFSTRLASAGVLAVLVAEIVLVVGKIEINIARFVAKYTGSMPVVDAKLAGPVVIALLAIMLVRRTAGIYTKWLAVVLLGSAVALFYTLDPALIAKFITPALQEGARHIK